MWFDSKMRPVKLWTIISWAFATLEKNAWNDREFSLVIVPLDLEYVACVSTFLWSINEKVMKRSPFLRQFSQFHVFEAYFSVQVGCNAVARENCTYFSSSIGTIGSGFCNAKVCPCSSDICQIRLDFLDFSIAGNCFSPLFIDVIFWRVLWLVFIPFRSFCECSSGWL